VPKNFDSVLELPVSPPGVEAVVLLTRAETPLPRGDWDECGRMKVNQDKNRA
jgi:hypothetical protein